MIEIWFYKAKYGTLVDKIIGWYTRGQYSHCEIYFPTQNVCISSSGRDGGTRKKVIPYDFHWDKIVLDKVDEEKTFNYASQLLGRPYDWVGIIFSQIIDLGYQEPNDYFCSEFVSEVLQDSCGLHLDTQPNRICPNALYKILQNPSFNIINN
jgi:hypothetical protein